MSKVKAGGSTKLGRDSNPNYLGIKKNEGEAVIAGNIIVRQRGTKILPGNNVRAGHDHTLYAVADGKVTFSTKRKTHFDNKVVKKKIVHVA